MENIIRNSPIGPFIAFLASTFIFLHSFTIPTNTVGIKVAATIPLLLAIIGITLHYRAYLTKKELKQQETYPVHVVFSLIILIANLVLLTTRSIEIFYFLPLLVLTYTTTFGVFWGLGVPFFKR
ncbi:MAG: hypothetical protein ACRDAX_03595 [Propionibacteriaceae bacterium]